MHKLDQIAEYLQGEPVTEHYKAWGMASVEYSCPRAELAYVPGAQADAMQACLAHELGHCEQYETLHLDPEEICPQQGSIEWEEDAWQRGFRIIGELGITQTQTMIEVAEACLQTYTYASMQPQEDTFLLHPEIGDQKGSEA